MKYYVTLRDIRKDGAGMNPTARHLILTAENEDSLCELIVENAYQLFAEKDIKYIEFAYTEA